MPNDALIDLPVAEFLNRLSSDAPTPGGGSVAALTGALAASLGQMVAAFTIGRKKFADVEASVRTIDNRLRHAAAMLRQLVDEDAAAYGVLSAAFKLDKSDTQRAARIAQAASLAGAVPLQTATLCYKVAADVAQLRQIGNPMLASDAEAAAHLAAAGQRAAAANVRANLGLMPPADAREIGAQLDALFE